MAYLILLRVTETEPGVIEVEGPYQPNPGATPNEVKAGEAIQEALDKFLTDVLEV